MPPAMFATLRVKSALFDRELLEGPRHKKIHPFTHSHEMENQRLTL